MKQPNFAAMSPVVAKAIEQMMAEQGDKFSLEKVNLAELERRTGISRARLRRMKEHGFDEDTEHAAKGRKASTTLLSGYTGRELLDALEGEKKIGLESTGHYGQNLKLFLENNGFSFMEFNPLLVNRFVRSKSLRKTKTDSIDALMIAQYLMTVEYKPYPPSFYTLEKLKSLTRFLVIQLYWSVLEFTRMQRKLQQVKTPDFSGIATVFRRHCWAIGM